MTGCLLGMVIGVIVAIIAMIRFTIMLMATSVGSLFVGVDEATDRIADSWIEQSNGRGVNLGYSPATRGGLKVGAVLMVIAGWIITLWIAWHTISFIYWIAQ